MVVFSQLQNQAHIMRQLDTGWKIAEVIVCA